MTDAYPLAWPHGWPRTKSRQRARFDMTMDRATREVVNEIARLGGRYVVISTNIPVRRDGLPYANARPNNADPGVAVYFERKGKQMVFACDKWDQVKDNIRAVCKTIEAMRGIERWGASDMMERAFSAFTAIEPPRSPWGVLGVKPNATREEVEAAYRAKAKEVHPDTGGSTAAMAELNQARDDALRA